MANQDSRNGFFNHLRNRNQLDPKASVANVVLAGDSLSSRQLWELTNLSAHDFADEIAAFFGLKRLTLPQMIEAKSLTSKFSLRFLRESLVFPHESLSGSFALAVADPFDEMSRKAAEMVLGSTVELVVASLEDIATVLGERHGGDEFKRSVVTEPEAAVVEENLDGLRDLASGAPVVRAVNDLLERAIDLRASDIHIEPFRTGLTVRLRVDGLLQHVQPPIHVLPHALISRIKIMAGLNIAERRLPQDGSARLQISRNEIDVRVATVPTQHGESAVIRLLPRDRGILDILRLGLSPRDESVVRRLLELQHGMLAITGPTGSGKTTTLATMLSLLNTSARKILTIEDPVEYEIPGVTQTQVKPSIGLTFAAAMRAFVRQDPDVIMVGEVRDGETANIAIHAALTGHLVLTTLHTETSTAAIPRLLDLGVEAFLLKSTLRAVIGQRLVRMLCDRCKSAVSLDPAHLAADPRYEALGFKVSDIVFEPTGCERCAGSGYRGRIGVFEALEISGEVRDLIVSRADSATLDKAAERAGMTTMLEDAVVKCRSGATSVAEVLRVTTMR